MWDIVKIHFLNFFYLNKIGNRCDGAFLSSLHYAAFNSNLIFRLSLENTINTRLLIRNSLTYRRLVTQTTITFALRSGKDIDENRY